MYPKYAYVGTFTTEHRNAHGTGIYVYKLHDATSWELIQEVEAFNPGYLAFDKEKNFLYASEGDGVNVSAYAIDKETKKIQMINSVPSGGLNGAFISVSSEFSCVYIAHFGSGMVSAVEINQDGSLGKVLDVFLLPGETGDLKVQKHSQPHQIIEDPAGKYLHICDRGTDCVYSLRFNGSRFEFINMVSLKPAIGGRHMCFSKDSKFAYVLSEHIGAVVTLRYDKETGILSPFRIISALPEDFFGVSTGSEIALSDSGKYLYVTNRGHNSIGQFAVDETDGTVLPDQWIPCGGNEPRYFIMDEGYFFMGNEFSDNITVFEMHGERIGKQAAQISMKSPACILFK